ncbi:myb family transcription factor family protein [Hibiscus syriacus]|uniref:Myb family transcription factor family protein n=1 Tax=Hibiscus syriacus TaxID=106335 RepID=A0A6A2XYW6_HIBSY|nr:myb family transcription factor family protein [Hibiscus syriacus]
MVYVGQLCLSWEILHWQYEKAIEIWETDRYGLRTFNEVASEFQQFQVLMQRFIENESFEGPRVQNYVKNRCVLRNLLQVPVIREDSMKDKRKGRRKGRDDYDDDNDAIRSDMLVEIMEESIRIFWRFVRSDKDANVVIKNSRKGTQVEPFEPADVELLAEVQTSLQKKDRKLKDIVRSGNCILRKLRKNQEANSDNVLHFFCQVDLKLVARVLNMSKVTKTNSFGATTN